MTADDGYEPEKTTDAMHLLYEKQKVFGFIGNVGTPTAAVALPFALDHRALFCGNAFALHFNDLGDAILFLFGGGLVPHPVFQPDGQHGQHSCLGNHDDRMQ